MAKIDLGHDEVILQQDTSVVHDRGRMFDSYDNELILTNHALIVVHKGPFGGVKDVCRFPLNDIKIVNGAPQAVLGRSSSGDSQLHVYFSSGVEAFTLDEPDDGFEEGEGSAFSNLFTSEKEKAKRKSRKEKEYVSFWCDSIARAVLGLPQVEFMEGHGASRAGVMQAAVGGIAAAMGVAPDGSPRHSAAASAEAPVHATCRCIGCMAPLSGVRGQKATCSYCDTEQVIEGGR